MSERRGGSDHGPGQATQPEGEPAVGNVLGFSLLLRDRKALLRLQRRGLSPGVRLSEYEAEIPGVRFPLRAPMSASAYRQRRCAATRVELSIKHRAIAAFVRRRLVGNTIADVRVVGVRIELLTTAIEGEDPGPSVHIEGRTTGGELVWLWVACQLSGHGRELVVQPYRTWLLGGLGVDATRLWAEAAAKIVPGSRVTDRGAVRLDPARLALTRPFVAAGWKAPNLVRLTVRHVALHPRGCVLELDEATDDTVATAVPPHIPMGSDKIAEILAQARTATQQGQAIGPALERLELALRHHRTGRIAALRWCAEATRFRDRQTCVRALRQWLELAPGDPSARRLLVSQLALAGEATAMARLLAASCRLPHPAPRLARLQLALARTLLRMNEPSSAVALLEPLAARTDLAANGSRNRLTVRAEIMATLAEARADDPRVATQWLTKALTDLSDPHARASIRAAVAGALHRTGHLEASLRLWVAACQDAPEDDELLDAAIGACVRLGELREATDLLRVRLGRADETAAAGLRRRLVHLLLRRDDGDGQTEALSTVGAGLDAEPNAPDLLRLAAELERKQGNHQRAAEYLGRLGEAAPAREDQLAAAVEQARMLHEGGDSAAAYAALSPALESAQDPEPDVLELALDIAPPKARAEILDRMIAIDAGQRGAEALLERALRTTSPNQRRRDLLRVVDLLEDPRPALAELAQMAPETDAAPWAMWADACADRDDDEAELRGRTEAGLRLLAAHRSDDATEQLVRAAALAPEDLSIVLALGLALAREGRAEEAATELLRVVDSAGDRLADLTRERKLGLDPKPGGLEMRSAELAAEAGRTEDAIRMFVLARDRLPDGDPLAHAAAARVVSMLLECGRADEALAASDPLLSGLEGPARGGWLARLAPHANAARRRSMLEEAAQLRPDDSAVLDALETTLTEAHDRPALESLLRARIDREVESPTARAGSIRRLVQMLQHAELDDDADPARLAAEVGQLYEQLLAIAPDDVDALLHQAHRCQESKDEEAAAGFWQRAVTRLDPEDPRGYDPLVALGRRALTEGRPTDARELLQRAAALRPDTSEPVELLTRVADELDDPVLTIQTATALRAATETPRELAVLELRLARAKQALGRVDEAGAHLEAAASYAEAGSALHLEVAEAWLHAATHSKPDVAQEAAARAQLRKALGADLPPLELRAEAVLLAERLRQPDQAVAVLEEGLGHHPTHELLLSTLKQICAGAALLPRYLGALEGAIESLTPSEARDRLATELAFCAMEDEDAPRVLEALERVSSAQGNAPELLDLRDWAVRTLGLQSEELKRVEQHLETDPKDMALVARLRRLQPDTASTVERLVELADRCDPDTARSLSESALALALERSRNRGTLLRALRAVVERGPSDMMWQAWPLIEQLALDREDEASIADLIGLAQEAEAAGVEGFRERADQLLDVALVKIPAAPHLHRALWSRLESESDTIESRAVLARARLDHLVETHQLQGVPRATLYVGFADLLDRRRAASFLAGRAADDMEDPEAFATFMSALEERNHWPEVLRLLTARADQATARGERVECLKHLAHVCADILGDPGTAIRHLETALEVAPTDPDLLLPLLDHHYAQQDLGRAIELTIRVLEHIAMGDAAFSALAHRGADAALARSDHAVARDLLRRVVKRRPGDVKTKARLAELEALASDPEHRVKLLATIAGRQTGAARLEALEERARLLIDPLERPDDAVEDLKTVVSEAPDRTDATRLLAGLYTQRARWSELVALLENWFPRTHGTGRCAILRRIAGIYRDHLYDLPRAEQALRLALEHLGPDTDDADSAEAMRRELVASLEQQGRYVDLAIYLERELEPELDGEVAGEDIHPGRLELMIQLARIYRDYLDDEIKAARIYEGLERAGHLPDEGLATLARWYRSQKRHGDLVRIMTLRSRALGEAGEVERKAAVDQRIGELLEGPLRRPHEAAPYYLEAYLADPAENVNAGAHARLLLASTDSVENVRKRLLDRLPTVTPSVAPALLTLLGDLLAPHDDFEAEAETQYRDALQRDPGCASASEGLGRLLARQGRLADAVIPLTEAAKAPEIEASRAAEDAAIAARALLELDRPHEAEGVLKAALERAPDSQRALLELARLYHRLEKPDLEAAVLDNLSQLPVSSMLRAEVAFRRGMLQKSSFDADPLSPAAERARERLLEAVSADANHVAARQALLELATAREEWSIVAHMHYLAIRELSPGPARAVVHLDLAETYLHRLDDVESAMRNLESAIQQAATDVVVVGRTSRLAASLPDPRRAAERFEHIASGDNELDDAARARLWLLAADLRMVDDDIAAAEAASAQVLSLPTAPEDAAAAATRNLETLQAEDDRDLRQQKSGLLQLLDHEEQPVERLHILGRLREIGRALGDPDLVERSSREQLELAHDLTDAQPDEEAATVALRDLFAERGDYEGIVALYEDLADRAEDPDRAARILSDAAGFAWHGLRDPKIAAPILRRALHLRPMHEKALDTLGEIARSCDDPELGEIVYREIEQLDAEARPAPLTLQLAILARRLGRYETAAETLRTLVDDPELAFDALGQLDAVLARLGQADRRLPVLRRYYELAAEREVDDLADVALELCRVQRVCGATSAAWDTCCKALERDPNHKGLVRLQAELLEHREDWAGLAQALERLAALSLDDRERAMWLTRTAQVRLDRGEPNHATALAEARRLLTDARTIAPASEEARAVLLPLAYSQRRWSEVIAIAGELQSIAGHDHDTLILAALSEAYLDGSRTLADVIGPRHDASVRQRYLYPGVRQVLQEVATRGPLPRLDAVLSAAATLRGGGGELLADLDSWSAGKPLEPGLTLGLARLHEARGEAATARHLYQIAAFMAPDGPVPGLSARLPQPVLPRDPVAAGWAPMEGRSALRTLLHEIRHQLVGLRRDHGTLDEPPNAAARAVLEAASTIVSRMREPLGLELPVRWTRQPVPGAIGVRNLEEPTIVLGPGSTGLAPAEFRYRLAHAAGTIAMGLAIIDDAHGIALPDLLDAFGQLANPSHEPTGSHALAVADTLTNRGVYARRIGPGLRTALAEELVHWLTSPSGLDNLRVSLSRAQLLFATRISGHLDGALWALARDLDRMRGGKADVVATLRTPAAVWLLRSIGLY